MLGRGLRRARFAILWEHLWPALATMATAIGLFLALSWLGLWQAFPPLGRPIGLLVFFVLGWRRRCRCSGCAGRPRSRACGGLIARACCRTARQRPLPTA